MKRDLSPETVLHWYKNGLFPMAERAGDPRTHWISPNRRGQLSIPGLHIPRSLQKTLKKAPFEIRVDTAFEEVIDACSTVNHGRNHEGGTWINRPIRDVFVELHRQGHAHSVECWKDGKLAGGLYGLALGGAFCGESMFSRETDASKVALVHLCARLWKGGFTILDTQFVNDHLKQFGPLEIDGTSYLGKLQNVLSVSAPFLQAGEERLEDRQAPDPDAAKAMLEEYMGNRARYPTGRAMREALAATAGQSPPGISGSAPPPGP